MLFNIIYNVSPIYIQYLLLCPLLPAATPVSRIIQSLWCTYKAGALYNFCIVIRDVAFVMLSFIQSQMTK